MAKGARFDRSRNARLPSLDLLKGFEAAARHLSFTRAAEELYLTQSALSRQVATLESQLGTPLFQRLHRELKLTVAGRSLHAATRELLNGLAETIGQIRHDDRARPLTVSTNQPFASLWLIPRLSRFRERHPKLDVFISADNRIVDLDRERIDLAIRYCMPSMAPEGAPRLFGERLVPVCSPALSADPTRPLKRPQDLTRHVLLHIDDERGRFPWLNWSVWLAAIGIRELVPAGSLRFSHFDQVVQAAVDGQGVALGRVPLLDRLLAGKKLVAPFRDRYATARAYFAVRGAQSEHRPDAEAFIAWLLEEAAREVEGGIAADAESVASAPSARWRKAGRRLA